MSTVDPQRWAQAQDILADALEMEEGGRAAFVAQASGGDKALEAEVLSLLEASSGADAYFQDLAGRAGMTVGDGAPAAEPAPDLSGRVVGAYRLGALLGRGGMGAVYSAERADGQFEQRVALKILPLGAATPAAHRRFLEERRILARLEHPNIARLYDGGVTDDGTPYFVMERVDGVPLGEFCASMGLGIEERLRLFLHVCDTVAFAHAKLVVHRDLKPNNILVTSDGTVKLLDFGIARLLEPGMREGTATALGGRLMTPRYASPEQLRGDPVTTSADVYALGVILYEILTGISPYDLSSDTMSLVDAVCSQNLTVPSVRVFQWAGADVQDTADVRGVVAAAESMGSSVRGLSRTLRGDLDNILLMTLRKEPARRYSSVEALAEDLRRHLNGFPVKARPDGVAYVAGRFLRRNALAATVATAMLLLLSTLMVLSVRFAVTTREQSQEIARERDRAREIAHFMRELFEVANPAMARGETVTARELLDAGVHKIREDHPNEPALQAEMLTVLGTVYHHLGLTGPGVELLHEASAIQRDLPDVHEEDKATTLVELGHALSDAGQAAEAAKILREGRDRLQAVRGPGDPEVALATFQLARNLHHQGSALEAESEFRTAIVALRGLGGATGTELATSLYLVADYLQAKGESPEEAEANYREALSIIQVREGREHPDVPPIMAGLARAQAARGQVDSATVLLREALTLADRIYRNVDGGNSPALAEIHLNMGTHLSRAGDPAEAETHLRRAERILSATSRPRPDLRGTAVLALATLLRNQGRLGEALEEYGRAAQHIQDGLGPGTLLEGNVQLRHGELLLEMGRGAEAETLFNAALANYGAALGDDSPRLQRIRELLTTARRGDAPR